MAHDFGIGVVVGITIFWFSFRIARVNKLEQMVHGYGGNVEFVDDFCPKFFGHEIHFGWFTRQPVEIWISGSPPLSTREIQVIANFSSLKRLALRVDSVVDEHLEILSRCENLSQLDLEGSSVSDAGIAHFVDHEKLSLLMFPQTQVTEKAVDSLLKMKSLKTVLSGDQFGNEAMARLSRAGIHCSRRFRVISKPAMIPLPSVQKVEPTKLESSLEEFSNEQG